MTNSKINFNAAILAILFLFLSDASFAETLKWEDCVKETKRNHPDLISAKAKLDKARASRFSTISSALPQISSNISQSTAKSTSGSRSDYSKDL